MFRRFVLQATLSGTVVANCRVAWLDFVMSRVYPRLVRPKDPDVDIKVILGLIRLLFRSRQGATIALCRGTGV